MSIGIEMTLSSFVVIRVSLVLLRDSVLFKCELLLVLDILFY